MLLDIELFAEMESMLCAVHGENLKYRSRTGVGLIERNGICMFNVSVHISSAFTWA